MNKPKISKERIQRLVRGPMSIDSKDPNKTTLKQKVNNGRFEQNIPGDPKAKWGDPILPKKYIAITMELFDL